MTVATTGVEYVIGGDGATTSFTYPYRFDNVDDLSVEIIRADGQRQAVTHTATGSGSGATVTVTSEVPAADEKVAIYRKTPLRQGVNYALGNFPSSAHTAAADRLVLMMQERAAVEARSLRLARGTTAVKEIDPSVFAGKSIAINEAGEDFEAGPSVPDIAAALQAAADAAASQAAAGASASAAAGDAAAAAGSASTASGAQSGALAASLGASQSAGEAAVSAAAAADALGALHGYLDRASIAAKDVPETARIIRVPSYSSIVPAGAPLDYRRSSAAEIDNLGLTGVTEAWVTSADGAYWLLDVLLPGITMFGAYAHASMAALTHEAAVDSTAAITAARAYARAMARPLVVDGYFLHVGELVPEPGEVIFGLGRHLCGVQIRCTAAETGLRVVNENVTIKGLEVQVYLTEPKPAGGGTGLIGNALTFGRYFDGGGVTMPRGYYVDDMLLSRKDNETGYISYNGIALQVSGGSNQGYVGVIEVSTRHSVAYMSHWNGNGAAPHASYTDSRHPRYFTIEKLILTGSEIEAVCTFSAVASLRVGSLIAEQARKLVTVLPGDDTDEFNVGQPNVGALLRIDQLVCNNLDTQADPVDDAAFSAASVGTSKFQLEEGLPKKRQLPIHISVGELTMHTDDTANLPFGIDLFEFYGSFEVEHANITGFTTALRARRSRGNLRVNFDHTDGKVLVSGSDMIVTGLGDRGDPDGYGRDAADLDASYNLRAEADGWPAALAANDITRGDTTLTIPAGITEDLVRGDEIEVTGTTGVGVETVIFPVDQFSESGLTIINIGHPFPHSMTGVTVAAKGLSRVDVDFSRCLGSRSGVVLEGARARVRGADAGRFAVLAIGTDTFAQVEVTQPVTGLSRNYSEAYTLYDVFMENGPTVHIGGLLGAGKLSAVGDYYTLGATGTPNAKVLIDRAHIVDRDKIMVAGDQIDLEVGAHTTADGLGFSAPRPAWSDGIEIGGATAGITYSLQSQYYEVIGNFVFLQFECRLTSKGAATGSIWLPVPIDALPGEHTPVEVTMDDVAFTSGEVPAGYVDGSIIRFIQQSNTVDPSMNDAQLTDATGIRLKAFYRWR